MRLEPPRPVAAPVKAEVVKAVAPDDKAHPATVPAVAPATQVVVAPVPAASSEPPKVPHPPKYELVPDLVQPKSTRLQDILPYFVPPPAPVSKATYEEK